MTQKSSLLIHSLINIFNLSGPLKYLCCLSFELRSMIPSFRLGPNLHTRQTNVALETDCKMKKGSCSSLVHTGDAAHCPMWLIARRQRSVCRSLWSITTTMQLPWQRFSHSHANTIGKKAARLFEFSEKSWRRQDSVFIPQIDPYSQLVCLVWRSVIGTVNDPTYSKNNQLF